MRLPNVKLVVNKSSNIDNTFRNFEMEVLAARTDATVNANGNGSSNGDASKDATTKSDFVVSVRENGAKFEFDFSKVYWNPRLVTEHQRIVDLLKPGDVLFDVFAGVGPFAVVAAMKSKRSKNNPNGIRCEHLNHFLSFQFVKCPIFESHLAFASRLNSTS